MSRDRLWVWYGQTSHRIRGYGNSFGPIYGKVFTTCMTVCGLRVEVHVPEDAVLAEAGQPTGRPACPECVAAP